MRRVWLTVAIATMLSTACGADAATLTEAAAKLDVPAEFEQITAETLQGFSETTRRFTFDTDLSQQAACELARDTLATWADQDLPEPTTALPRTLCSYELRNPVNHSGVDIAVARVRRAKVGDDYVEDDSAANGVDSIVIFFRTES